MEQNARILIEIKDATPRFDYLKFSEPICWQMKEGQHWAIVGPNGGGKTLFVDMLLGKYALKTGTVICKDEMGTDMFVSSVVKCVAFRDLYSIIDTENGYYQQRWNRGDEQFIPLVKDLVLNADQEWLNTLLDWFGIEDLMEKEVNLLSSGELRKFLIVRSLLSKPRILILDNPFLGLDAASRTVLNDLLVRLSELDNLQIVLLLCNPQDIPDSITDVLPIKDKQLFTPMSRQFFFESESVVNNLFPKTETSDLTELKSCSGNDSFSFSNAAILKNIHIKYGSRTILNKLDWTVQRGEKWALLGPNGSGKSTLLSLICGDNPQAYANDITLFDRKRGSGESIWDIKKHIGYVSPEMHLYYQNNVKCLDVVSSGFFDTIGLYRKCTTEQEMLAKEWMMVFNVVHLSEVSFQKVSSGEQRLLLLARALVKNPELLILDEPLHGLDVVNKNRVKKILEDFCDGKKSLIYVTHYQNEIPNVVDKQLVLTKNK